MGEKNWQEIAILVILLIFFVVGIFGIFAARNSFTKTPTITVNLDDTTYTDKQTVSVTGNVKNAKSVDINGQTVQADASGNFAATVNLNTGNNEVKVTAKNDGKTADVTKTIVYQPNQSVAGAQTPNQQTSGSAGQGNLNQSGPAEDIAGVFGLTAIIVSLVYYYDKKRKVVETSKYSLFG